MRHPNMNDIAVKVLTK